MNGSARWLLRPGNDAAETGTGNAGSNYDLFRYSDAGASLGRAFEIRRSDGTMTVDGALTASTLTAIAGTLTLVGYGGAGANTGIVYFGNTGTKYLYFDGTFLNVMGARLTATGDVTSYHGVGTDGTYYFNKANTAYLEYAAGAYRLVGGNLNLSGGSLTAGGITCTSMTLSGPFNCQALTCTSLNTTSGPVTCGAITCTALTLSGPFACTTLDATGAIRSKTTSTTGSLLFGTGSTGLSYDGTKCALNTRLDVTGQMNASGSVSAIGYRCRQGYNGALQGNVFNFAAGGGGMEAWLDDGYVGQVSLRSDLEAALQPVLEELQALRARVAQLEAR
jgi:hypothetical protein